MLSAVTSARTTNLYEWLVHMIADEIKECGERGKPTRLVLPSASKPDIHAWLKTRTPKISIGKTPVRFITPPTWTYSASACRDYGQLARQDDGEHWCARLRCQRVGEQNTSQVIIGTLDTLLVLMVYTANASDQVGTQLLLSRLPVGLSLSLQAVWCSCLSRAGRLSSRASACPPSLCCLPAGRLGFEILSK